MNIPATNYPIIGDLSASFLFSSDIPCRFCFLRDKRNRKETKIYLKTEIAKREEQADASMKDVTNFLLLKRIQNAFSTTLLRKLSCVQPAYLYLLINHARGKKFHLIFL